MKTLPKGKLTKKVCIHRFIYDEPQINDKGGVINGFCEIHGDIWESSACAGNNLHGSPCVTPGTEWGEGDLSIFL